MKTVRNCSNSSKFPPYHNCLTYKTHLMSLRYILSKGGLLLLSFAPVVLLISFSVNDMDRNEMTHFSTWELYSHGLKLVDFTMFCLCDMTVVGIISFLLCHRKGITKRFIFHSGIVWNWDIFRMGSYDFLYNFSFTAV